MSPRHFGEAYPTNAQQHGCLNKTWNTTTTTTTTDKLYEEGNYNGILKLDKDLEETRKTETGIENQQI